MSTATSATRDGDAAWSFPHRRQALLAGDSADRRAQAASWAGAVLIVTGLHLFGAFALLRPPSRETVPPDDMGAIMIELAPEVQRAASQVDAALATPVAQAEAIPPEPPTEEAMEPATNVPEAPVEALAPLPPPREVSKPVQHQKRPAPHRPPEHTRHILPKPAARTASAPRSEQQAAATTAASIGAASSQSAADWKSLVSAALNRHKRFPAGLAVSGSPTLRVTIAASGHVAGVAVIASSGSAELDEAAIQTVHRASPLPPPPAGPQTLTFRMNFRLR